MCTFPNNFSNSSLICSMLWIPVNGYENHNINILQPSSAVFINQCNALQQKNNKLKCSIACAWGFKHGTQTVPESRVFHLWKCFKTFLHLDTNYRCGEIRGCWRVSWYVVNYWSYVSHIYGDNSINVILYAECLNKLE